MREEVEILLVEDRDEDAELAIRALARRRLANRVHRVCDGEEAIEFLESKGRYANRTEALPRVMLLDLQLPRVDGLQVLRHVRSDPKLRSLPVVVLTSSAEERDIVESYSLGVNSYIVKPVEFEKFVQSVEQLGLYWVVLNQPPAR
jgi:two-component system, response regulator